MGILNQVITTAIISYMCTTMGLMYTWPSSVYKLFSSANTPLDRVMTDGELSLLGSISSIAAVIITPFFGYLVDLLGRKHLFTLLSLLQVLSWLIVEYSNRVEVILASIFITGLTTCMFLVIPMYLCEICQESIRGSMTSGSITFYAIGMLISYLLGGLTEYKTMNHICLCLTILGVMLLVFIKESPLFLMKKGFEKEAAATIAYYRGQKVNSNVVFTELDNIRRMLNPELHSQTPEEQTLKSKDEVPIEKSKWKLIRQSRATRRALFICIVLLTASMFQGLVVVQVYAQPLFEEAIPNISAMWSSVFFAIVTIISGFLGAYLVETAGRRNLMIYASMASGIFCVLLGTLIQFRWGTSWLTAACLYLFCVSYSLGAGTVPYVVVAEAFLPEIKSMASMISIEWCFLCGFVILYIFNPIVTIFGLGPVFYVFAVVCFLSAIFCICFLPETKGLTIDAIQVLFDK